jgi:hypothetical protein
MLMMVRYYAGSFPISKCKMSPALRRSHIIFDTIWLGHYDANAAMIDYIAA